MGNLTDLSVNDTEGGNTRPESKYDRERLDVMVNDEQRGFILTKMTDETVLCINGLISGGSRMAILCCMALVYADVCLSARILKNWRGL